ncbi:MAG TPA: hypothetical protein GXX69_07390 [Firmicutes bacterium]|nr:hypothetical protein [Bacillota bacterium]
MHLTLDDIEILERKGTIIVRSGKGREVPLAVKARKAISDYLEVRPATKIRRLFWDKEACLKPLMLFGKS